MLNKHLHRNKQFNKPGNIGTTLLILLLVAVLLLCEFSDNVPVHAADTYQVIFSVRNFGIQSLHAQSENLHNPRQATFRLDTGASIWYGIDVNSIPSGLRPAAVDPLSDIVSAMSVHYGLLPAAGIMPINLDGSLAQQILLQASFSGPNQKLQMTLNPFDGDALTLDVIHILLDILSNNTLGTQVGLLGTGNLSKVLTLASHIRDLSDFITDFSKGVEAELLHHSWDTFTDAKHCAADFFKLMGQQIELQDLATLLTLVLGPAIGGVASMLASYAAGIGEFITLAGLAKTLADFLLSLGSYLFQHNALPTMTLQTVGTGVPPVPTTPVPTPIAPGMITEFSLPSTSIFPSAITSGSDGNLWFTDATNINRITSDGTFSQFPVSNANSGMEGITSGSDGNLWFTNWIPSASYIGRITPDGTITQFPVPTTNSILNSITSGPDSNLWFTESGISISQIGRITPGGVITEFPLPVSQSDPEGITPGPDGNLWFTESNKNQIGRITPEGTITEFTVPTTNSSPWRITLGPDGNLWFTEMTADQIGRITPGGTITEFPVPTANSGPWDITSGPDGNLWFTEYSSGKIGRISLNGVITEFLLRTANSGPDSIGPDSIISNPDGDLWFAEDEGHKIGYITP